MPILIDCATGKVAGQILGETHETYKCIFANLTFEVSKNDPGYRVVNIFA